MHKIPKYILCILYISYIIKVYLNKRGVFTMTNANSQEILLELQAIMLKTKISKKDLADRLNITQSAISSRFNQKNISIDTLLELCNAIGVNMNIDFSFNDTNK